MTHWFRWIAPSAGHALRRTLLILLAALVVLVAEVALEGLPSSKRDLHRDDRRFFHADLRRGPLVFLEEFALIAVCALVGRRVFQIHL